MTMKTFRSCNYFTRLVTCKLNTSINIQYYKTESLDICLFITQSRLCQSVMCADNTVLTLASKCIEHLEINCINISFKMAKQNCDWSDLILNENKITQVIYRSRRDQSAGLSNLKAEESTKCLDIILHKNLDWKPHINQL